MQYLLFILMGLYLGVGVALLHVGPLSELIRDAEHDALVLQARQGERVPALSPSSALVSRLIVSLFVLLLWPCLWPTAVCRREDMHSRFFSTHPWYDGP